ncbi:hypothetical protein GDO78_001706 [Eleutherodactylus coqui]|uniref:Uncharacterized protein n=1 Tax=Eleutherodactylus coqui TaxID=57060 RepID=A0A8J6FUZ7_ELECQ|nr:hypothetical protein GDO78_001706 [Eleutherodactylus coqui]
MPQFLQHWVRWNVQQPPSGLQEGGRLPWCWHLTSRSVLPGGSPGEELNSLTLVWFRDLPYRLEFGCNTQLTALKSPHLNADFVAELKCSHHSFSWPSDPIPCQKHPSASALFCTRLSP